MSVVESIPRVKKNQVTAVSSSSDDETPRKKPSKKCCKEKNVYRVTYIRNGQQVTEEVEINSHVIYCIVMVNKLNNKLQGQLRQEARNVYTMEAQNHINLFNAIADQWFDSLDPNKKNIVTLVRNNLPFYVSKIDQTKAESQVRDKLTEFMESQGY